ncbi:siderophore-interacting protein [Brevibacterium sp. GP-SGM9]|uniref:siderophore-interacting protein n=1 Tax=Brevibacterium sp. GP-SGM9 TaxID=3376990 RepID=UPI0039A6287A
MAAAPSDSTQAAGVPRPWAYTAFPVEVSAVARVTPNFVRITFTGDTLEQFAPWGLDQRIKLVFPHPDGRFADFGLLADPTPHPSHWYALWKQLPAEERNVLRTYTPSGIRPAKREVDVDMLIHDPPGPASQWAQSAEVGDRLVINGPDARNGYTGYGLHWSPGEAANLLLAGDETAFPAMANIHSSLGGGMTVEILAESSDPLDGDLLPTSANVVVRQPNTEPGTGLEELIWEWGARQNLATLDDDVYIWIAGESDAVVRIRRYLTRQLGVAKSRIAFFGYWRAGGPLTG